MSDKRPEVVVAAETAYEAVRRINHITGGVMPAPLVYSVLGSLKMVGHVLPQALRQLADGLALSLDVYQVYEDDGTDPAVSVEAAGEALREAAGLAAQCGQLLERAQSAINGQGYHP